MCPNLRSILRRREEIGEAVERGLGGAGKLKIVRLLMTNPNAAFTRYAIGKSVPLDPVSIRNDLKTLVEIGWVVKLKVQHLSKYSLNLDNDTVRRLFECFRDVGYL